MNLRIHETNPPPDDSPPADSSPGARLGACFARVSALVLAGALLVACSSTAEPGDPGPQLPQASGDMSVLQGGQTGHEIDPVCSQPREPIQLDEVADVGFSGEQLLDALAAPLVASANWLDDALVSSTPSVGETNITLTVDAATASVVYLAAPAPRPADAANSGEPEPEIFDVPEQQEPLTEPGDPAPAAIAFSQQVNDCDPHLELMVGARLQTADGAFAENLQLTIRATSATAFDLHARLRPNDVDGSFVATPSNRGDRLDQLALLSVLTEQGWHGEITAHVETALPSAGPDTVVLATRAVFLRW